MVNSQLVQESIDEQTYWASPDTQEVADTPHVVFLLPSFDEYLVGYRDRSAVLDPAHAKQAVPGGGILSATVVVDGQVVGGLEAEDQAGQDLSWRWLRSQRLIRRRRVRSQPQQKGMVGS